MRTSRESRHPDVADRAADPDVRAAVNPFRKIAQMPITTDKAITMANVDYVAIASFATREDHDAVAHGSHWSPHRGCVIGSLVIPPHSENRMITPPENTRDTTE